MAETFFVELLGNREGWPNDITETEQQIMQEHFVYLQELTAKKKVLLAGPVLEDVFGLIILHTASREEAEAIMAEEPSVVKGVHTYRLRPMVASLQAHHVPRSRYPEPVADLELRKEIEIAASVEAVYAAWTTPEGVRSFLAENVIVEPRPGGPFEIYFSMEAPEGSRGSEDCCFLALDPPAMLSFEWNAPPHFGPLRDQRTVVVIHFDPLDSNRTRLRFVQRGWGEGEKWREVYDYFDRAWASVLGNLQKRFAENSTE